MAETPLRRPFRIVHLSDLHVTRSPADTRMEPRFRRLRGMNEALRYLASTAEVASCDLLLVTGDVTDQGHLEAWRTVRRILDAAGLLERTLMVPGNHDVCSLGARLGWPEKLREADLERLRRGLQIVDQPVRFPWVRRVEDRVVIFGLDSNNSGNRSVVGNAMGRLGDRQLDRLAELLARHRTVPVKLVALHHSPNIPGRKTAKRRGQDPLGMAARWSHEIPASERRSFRRLCLSHRVRLVLHGHLHQSEDRRVTGLRIVGAPASTEPTRPDRSPFNYRFWRYTVHGAGGRVTRELLTV